MNQKNVLILGGGLQQIPLLKKAKQEGYKVFLSDYNDNPPGKKYCHDFKKISTFSLHDNLSYAREKKVDYIMTVGTDQPVFTAAYVSEKLNLPCPISVEQGKMVTNKYFMKKLMVDNNIPTARFKAFHCFEDVYFDGLNFPVVMKPADSQGQRGIFVLTGDEETSDIKKMFEVSKEFALSNTVILEEFYPGDEITVNCWVKDGQSHILLITDRLHYDDTIVLGLCKQQRYPSKASENYLNEINKTVQRLAYVFGIKDGPLYIQMIIGSEGAKIVEFGYRLGGGFESETIPRVTGIDILDLYFRLVTEGKNNFQPDTVMKKANVGSIFFMFARPGTAARVCLPDDFWDNHGRLFIEEKQVIGEIENATSRVGCFAFYTEDENEYQNFIERYDTDIAIYNEDGVDLLIHGIWE